VSESFAWCLRHETRVDENLSPSLVARLVRLFPESAHVRDLGFASATDTTIWNYAAQHGFVIVSKDVDFQQRALLRGHPPKVIWLRIGNCSSRDVEQLLTSRIVAIEQFVGDSDVSFLALS